MSLDKIERFKEELNYIKDSKIKNFTISALNSLPSYFWTIPASSTGKYHPSITTKLGGLVTHTKLAVRILQNILNLEMMTYTDIERDIMISAMMLHDGVKCGFPETKYTKHEHPITVCEYINSKSDVCMEIDKDTLECIFQCIKSHMGQWNTNPRNSTVLPKPLTGMQKLVHLADYLASRKEVFDMV